MKAILAADLGRQDNRENGRQMSLPLHQNILGDPTLADAICDRLLHDAYRIELRDDSMHARPGSTSKNEGKEAVADDKMS